jgi:hypothetical protein
LIGGMRVSGLIVAGLDLTGTYMLNAREEQVAVVHFREKKKRMLKLIDYLGVEKSRSL